MSDKYMHLMKPYQAYDSANGGWYPSEYSSYLYDRTAVNTVPAHDGRYYDTGRNTTSFRRTLKPFWLQSGTIRKTKKIVTPKTPFSTESLWDYVSGNNAYLRALNGVGDRKMSLGETLAESRSTFDMIAKNTTAVFNMFRNLKRGNFRGAARAVGVSSSGFRNAHKDISSKYLELIFGWKPLIDEIYNGVDVVQNGLNSHPDHLYISKKAKGKYQLTRTIPKSISTPAGSVVSVFKGHVKTTWKFTHPSYGRSLNQLGIYNIPQLAWNLLPSSFLVDWFIPIDSWLGAFTATEGLQHVRTYSVSYATHVGNYIPDTRYYQGGSVEYGVVQRRILSDDIPLPEAQLPHSVQQALTATALMLSRSRRR